MKKCLGEIEDERDVQLQRIISTGTRRGGCPLNNVMLLGSHSTWSLDRISANNK